MNDRFRFRAWNDKAGFIHFGSDYCYGCKWWDFPDVLKTKEWVVEQCTGLRDKNGRLIYEGDIVKEIPKELCIASYFSDECTYKVVFWYGRFGYTALDVNYPEQGDTFDFEFDKYDYEVIGNIHKNPELLEDK